MYYIYMLLEMGTLVIFAKDLSTSEEEVFSTSEPNHAHRFFPLIFLSKSTFFLTGMNLTAVPLHSAGY